MRKSFNIQEFLHCKYKHHETKLMDPSLSRAFLRYQEHNLKCFILVDPTITKQNNLPCFIDRFANNENLIFSKLKMEKVRNPIKKNL